MQRIIDLRWIPWTYASLVAFLAGVWAGNRFLAEGSYGEPIFNTGAFLLGALAGFAAASPLLLAFYVASRMADNQVEIAARLDGAGARPGAATQSGADARAGATARTTDE